jgi:hypothetical protein
MPTPIASRRESALRDYLFDHPELLFEKPISTREREVYVEGKYADLIFHVEGIHYIVELKRETITREAVGQVMEYYGRLRRLHLDRTYRMILVAPHIPAYRSEPLEEFGIRCAEVDFPEDGLADEEVVTENSAQRIAKAIRKSDSSPNSSRLSISAFSSHDFLPPANRNAREIAHELLLNGLTAMESLFTKYEVMPVKMHSVERPDLLCIPSLNPSQPASLQKVGVWWAYAFGASEQMPKNDTPNLSVNALPWGLDFAINAELMTSQQVLLNRIEAATAIFNKHVSMHGGLELQLWLKIEFRPRFYHWIPLRRVVATQNSGELLLNLRSAAEQNYQELRAYWLDRLSQADANMSAAEVIHMNSRNKSPNLALRIVRTFSSDDEVWRLDVERQKQRFHEEYAALKPLLEFFN